MLRMILKRPQQPSLWVELAITRERSFSSQIHKSKSKIMWLEACIEAVVFVALQPLSSYSWNRHTDTDTNTHTHTHTHSQLYRISRAATPMTFDHIIVDFSLMLLILDLRWTAVNSQPARYWLGTLSWQLKHQNNRVQSLTNYNSYKNW